MLIEGIVDCDVEVVVTNGDEVVSKLIFTSFISDLAVFFIFI